MVVNTCGLRFCMHMTHVSVFTERNGRFRAEIDLRRPSCGIWIGSTTIGGGLLKKFDCSGICWDVVVELFGYAVINVNNNFTRVRKNLGPKVVLFDRVVRN